MKRLRKQRSSLRGEHLAGDLLKHLARHLDECLSSGAGQVAGFSGGRDITLHEEVAPFGQDRGRAAPAVAEHLVPRTVRSDDFMDFHNGY